MYYHDRVLCTLAAMIALSYHGRRGQDKVQIENGKLALETDRRWRDTGAPI